MTLSCRDRKSSKPSKRNSPRRVEQIARLSAGKKGPPPDPFPEKLDFVHVDDTARAGTQDDLEVIAMAAAKIGVGPAPALDHADAVEALGHDAQTLPAANAIAIGADGIIAFLPVGLRIPPAAEIEAEGRIPVMAAMLPTKIECLVGLGHGLGGCPCSHLAIDVLLTGHGAFLSKLLLHLASTALLLALGLIIGLHGILAQLLRRHGLAVVFRHVLHPLTLALTRRASFTDAFLGL